MANHSRGIHTPKAVTTRLISQPRLSTRRGEKIDEWPGLALGWRELEAELAATSPPPVEARWRVAKLLRALGSARLQRFRTVFMLESIGISGGALEALHACLDSVPGWRTLRRRHLQDASLLGLADLDEEHAVVTTAGREELERARAEGYRRDLWEFIETRLHEVLVIPCPGCGTRTSLHWFWPEHECEHCGQELEAGEQAEIQMRTVFAVLSYYAA